MPATVVDAVRNPFPCTCACHQTLTLDERTAGIEALYRYDDAMRGFDYLVIWDLAAPTLWRVQQQALDTARWIAVRDTGCIHSRLLGFCIHELIHAYTGDVTKPNYGILPGLPYNVPESVPLGQEAEFLRPFNESEARAWVGLAPVAKRLFDIDWPVLPARDVGTYGFAGGSSLIEKAPEGYRRVAHYDSTNHKNRYYALARKIEEEARQWFTPERLDDLATFFTTAEERGRKLRKHPFPSAREMARIKPRLPGRNDLCICGSMSKWKHCHGAEA